MIKVIDIDKIFDKYIEGYVYKNIGKVKPEEIENKIPVLYQEFGKAKISELGGETPENFYSKESITELLECLKNHIEKKVPVSDFLCEAIESKKAESNVVVEYILKEEDEEFLCYLINILNNMNGKIPFSKYLEFVLFDYPENLVELATEILKKNVEQVKEKIIEAFSTASEEKKPILCEILCASKHDDKIFNILIKEFNIHKENIPLYCSFLTKYGDEKAIENLTNAIEEKNIKYSDFEELRFAIESLGGEYKKEKDFTNDKDYKKIKIENNTKIISSNK